MTETNTYLLALEALAELAPEINASHANGTPTLPSLAEILIDLANLPREALFLGIADDGLPILLNLHDPVPGPLLISADDGAGKTAFLRLIAKALIELHDPADVQFGVVTANPEEWKGYEQAAHCVGIFPVYQKSAMDFILSLGEWAHMNKSLQSVVLLVDDLSRMADVDQEAKDTLRWLLMRGPARHLWQIVSLDPSKCKNVLPWLDFFRTRVFGVIQNTSLAESITRSTGGGLETLVKGSQFSMREGTDWLRFWIPHTEECESK
jgi:hypothetical protein